MSLFSLIVTESAKTYLSKVIKEGEALSIGLKKSGCNGYAYVIETKKIGEINPDKFLGIPFIINQEDKNYLNNSIIDYKKEGVNAKLIINNPSVKYECGCGESFSF